MIVPPGFSLPGALRVLDHPHGHPVLDRVAGVEGFELDQDVGVDDTARDVVHADHRRVADGVEDRVADLPAGRVRHFRSYVGQRDARTTWCEGCVRTPRAPLAYRNMKYTAPIRQSPAQTKLSVTGWRM